jgi:hypothetical protein
MVTLPLLALAVAGLFAGFYLWARRQGLVTTPPAAAPGAAPRISPVTEATAYVGVVLILAGGVAALARRWDDISDWGHVGVFAAATALFLAVGLALRGVREAAAQRLVSVTWLLSVGTAAGTAGFAVGEVYGGSGATTTLSVGVVTTLYATALWLVRRNALQVLALFAGLVVTICGTIASVASEPPRLAFALSLWLFGLAWALLGWRRYLEPLWASIPLGVVLALLAPALAVVDHGWLYGLGLVTAAAAMGLAVPLRNTPLLALGTVAMFGYVTALVVRYFGDSLGVPAALAITGAVILVLATVTARLHRLSGDPLSGRAARRTGGATWAARARRGPGPSP